MDLPPKMSGRTRADRQRSERSPFCPTPNTFDAMAQHTADFIRPPGLSSRCSWVRDQRIYRSVAHVSRFEAGKTSDRGGNRAACGESSRDPDNVGQPTSTDPSQRIIYPSYSSLGSLRVLPIHAVKMDRSLLASAATAEADASIIAAVIGVSRRLRLRVAADGVETAEQCDFLKTHGCQEAQGSYFSAAVDPESFTLLTSSPAAPSA